MEYIAHLSKDKKLKPIIEKHGAFKLLKRKNVCLRLCASIISQQLSTKVAEVIYHRFLNLFEGNEPTPQMILNVSADKFRSIGMSNAKAAYVHNVAQFAVDYGMDSKQLHKMSNQEVIQHLTQIKGVGQWTVEMILMFTLAREDVFAIDDNGIQMAMKGIYKLDSSDKKKFKSELLRISEKWIPYRTYACRHLWEWKDGGT